MITETLADLQQKQLQALLEVENPQKFIDQIEKVQQIIVNATTDSIPNLYNTMQLLKDFFKNIQKIE
jgi:hypothetical protein